MHVLYDTKTFRILGRAQGTEKNSVYVSDEMWGRIASDSSAFRYYPDVNEVDIDPEFEFPVEDSIDQVLLVMERAAKEFEVPELDISLSFSGDLGPLLTNAMVCATYAPVRVAGRRNGSIVLIEVDAKAAAAIAQAYAKHIGPDND